MAAAQAKGVRVVLTVDRMSWYPYAPKTMKLLQSPKARTRLANEIAAELRASGADGVNLDFEPMPAEVRDDFTLFGAGAAERAGRHPTRDADHVRHQRQRGCV